MRLQTIKVCSPKFPVEPCSEHENAKIRTTGIGHVVLGDLLLCKEGSAGKVADEDNIETEVDCNDEYSCTTIAEISDESVPQEKIQFVKAVSSEDLLTGGYKFEDVVLPLPGSGILYPANDISETYHHLAEKDGIKLTESVHNAKEFSITIMTGIFRRVFQHPMNFEWELLTYIDSDAPLAETDLDTLSKSRPEDLIKAESVVLAEIVITKLKYAKPRN